MSTSTPLSEADTRTAPDPSIQELFDNPRPVSSYIRIETSLDSGIWARFMEPFIAGQEPFARTIQLSTELSIEEVFAGVPEHLIARDSSGPERRVVLVETPTFTVLVQRWSHNGAAHVRSSTRENLELAVKQVSNWFPEAAPVDESVPVDFWQAGSKMYTTTRSIDAPEWPEVARHYPSEVSQQLEALMAMKIGEPAGRVLLWHGRPGTGKTSAIRTLARAWRDQARFQVVLDPESAFAGSTALMQMLLADDNRENKRWRILVIEDADPLVAADGNTRTLSRLLNVGDGIVGQGLRVMVLLTTNQPPSRLHPAVARPGRCLSEIEFRRFTSVEAQASFPERAAELAERARELTLAEILTGADAPAADSEAFGQYL